LMEDANAVLHLRGRGLKWKFAQSLRCHSLIPQTMSHF
jgi:hypothetical protein